MIGGKCAAAFVGLLLPAFAAASEIADPAACPRWSTLFRQVAIDRDTGIPEATEHRKLAGVIAADRGKPQPFLVRDDDDEFYLWITVTQIYEHPWYTADRVEELVTHDCLSRLDRRGAPGADPKPS